MSWRKLFCLWLVIASVEGAVGQPPAYMEAVSSNTQFSLTPGVLADMIVDDCGLSVSQASTRVNAPGNPESDRRALGTFIYGKVAPGTPLPAENQDPSNPTAAYVGGIGIDHGVCLCTGVVSDTDSFPSEGRGVGVEGPNNGEPTGGSGVNPGEISTYLFSPIDQDFNDYAFPDPGEDSDGGDATVLEFNVTSESPGYLRMSFVFGSDENPDWIEESFNDSFIILVTNSCGETVNLATIKSPGSEPGPFRLQEIRNCGPPVFLENNTAPAPSPLVDSAHAIPSADRYDHEFGGFTAVLTRETPIPLPKGTYFVKIVIQDVGLDSQGNNDLRVDSALFIPEGGFKLFPLVNGDYNGDGIVDIDDYYVWQTNYGLTPADYYDGDGNGDCIVDAADYVPWQTNFGVTGNADLSADFDRNGAVQGEDLSIFLSHWGMMNCMSRFEGDADGDGAVDNPDLSAILSQWGLGTPDLGCQQEQMMTSGDSELEPIVAESAEQDAEVEAILAAAREKLDSSEFERLQLTISQKADAVSRAVTQFAAPLVKQNLPPQADANEDGKVDAADFAIIERAFDVSQ